MRRTQKLWDGRLALESAFKACELTGWKDVDSLIALANAQNLVQDQDAAIAAIDRAIALLKTDDPRMGSCREVREVFRGNLLTRIGVKEFFER